MEITDVAAVAWSTLIPQSHSKVNVAPLVLLKSITTVFSIFCQRVQLSGHLRWPQAVNGRPQAGIVLDGCADRNVFWQCFWSRRDEQAGCEWKSRKRGRKKWLHLKSWHLILKDMAKKRKKKIFWNFLQQHYTLSKHSNYISLCFATLSGNFFWNMKNSFLLLISPTDMPEVRDLK